MNALLYLPSRRILETPSAVGLNFTPVTFEADDGVPLHGWWVPAPEGSVGHVLLCHGNAGNIGDRVLHAALLCGAGFDVLLFDYRGYGRSGGRPSEEGTYRDARAARAALLAQPGVDARRVVYLGESLGAAVVLALALESPPTTLVLQSPFTSVREMARIHYPMIPRAAVPDAYPSFRRMPRLTTPLLVVHGDRDEIVPLMYGEALYEASREPKRLCVLHGVGHNDLISRAGDAWIEAIASWSAAYLPSR